jgi:hypothetical protein
MLARLPDTILADARRALWTDRSLNEELFHFLHRGHVVQLLHPLQWAKSVSVITPGDSNSTILCKLHFHGNMRPFWSQADDADELGARVYAVVGRLDTAPEILVRVGVYGYGHPLPVTAVFTGASSFTDLYLKEKDPCPPTLPTAQTAV